MAVLFAAAYPIRVRQLVPVEDTDAYVFARRTPGRWDPL